VLLHPRALFVIEQGWTEPVTVLALSLTLWAAARRPGWVPWAAGLLVASKQHLLLLAPLALLLVPRPLGVRGAAAFLARVVGTAAATWLPFVAWDPAGVLDSAVLFHVAQPFRTDALSYLPWLRQLGVTLPGWTGLAVAAPVAAVAAWRGARGRASFALWTALVLAAVFALGKQAFANYWFLVGAAACWAVATCDDEAASGPGAARGSEAPSGPGAARGSEAPSGPGTACGNEAPSGPGAACGNGAGGGHA